MENCSTSINREQRISYLVERILSGDEILIYELWEQLESLCAWYCRRIFPQLPASFKLEYDDLFNCGFIALHDAIDHYSLEKAGQFSFFYLFYLTSAIYRENGLSSGGHYKDGRRRFDPIITDATMSLDANVADTSDKPDPLYNFLSDEYMQDPAR